MSALTRSILVLALVLCVLGYAPKAGLVEQHREEIKAQLEMIEDARQEADNYRPLTDEDKMLLNDPSTPPEVRAEIQKRLDKEFESLMAEFMEHDFMKTAVQDMEERERLADEYEEELKKKEAQNLEGKEKEVTETPKSDL